jgi:hypothetical protein
MNDMTIAESLHVTNERNTMLEAAIVAALFLTITNSKDPETFNWCTALNQAKPEAQNIDEALLLGQAFGTLQVQLEQEGIKHFTSGVTNNTGISKDTSYEDAKQRIYADLEEMRVAQLN